MSNEVDFTGPGKPIQTPPVYFDAVLPVDSEQEAVLMAERLGPGGDFGEGPFPERIHMAKAWVDDEGDSYVLLTLLMIHPNDTAELQAFGEELVRWWNEEELPHALKNLH